jgi:hypothetical protein
MENDTLDHNDALDYQDYHEDTSHLFIKFYKATIKNEAQSKLAGRPIHEEKEMVQIRIAGDKNTILHSLAHDKSRYVASIGHLSYAERFPRHYEAFKKNEVQIGDGTPIEELTSLGAARIADLKAVNIHTIDALAGLSETALRKLGTDNQSLREMAKKYLEKANGFAVEGRLMAENEAMKDQIALLEDQIRQIVAEQSKKPTLSIPAKEKTA